MSENPAQAWLDGGTAQAWLDGGTAQAWLDGGTAQSRINENPTAAEIEFMLHEWLRGLLRDPAQMTLFLHGKKQPAHQANRAGNLKGGLHGGVTGGEPARRERKSGAKEVGP